MEKVIESTEYENCMDILGTAPKKASLAEFFGDSEEDVAEWEKEWIGMPEFTQENNPPYKRLIVNFKTEEDYKDFALKIDQGLTEKTKSIWHPKLQRSENSLKRWIEDQ
jgi:hypothetical protein